MRSQRSTPWGTPPTPRSWSATRSRYATEPKHRGGRGVVLWQDANGTRFGDLKFALADVVGGELKVIFAAVGSAAGYVTKLSPQYDALKPSLERLYARAAKQFGDPGITP